MVTTKIAVLKAVTVAVDDDLEGKTNREILMGVLGVIENVGDMGNGGGKITN